MAAKGKAKGPKVEPIAVGAKLRKAHHWFENLAAGTKSEAVKKRQKSERAKGPELSPEELAALADELEMLQRELNPLENRRKEIVGKLLPHWGHTGIEEIEGALGKTLFSTSFELAVDPEAVKKAIGGAAWNRFSARMLQAPLFLAGGKESTAVRDAAQKALFVKKLKVSITSPSSRRPKSGEPAEEGEEE